MNKLSQQLPIIRQKKSKTMQNEDLNELVKGKVWKQHFLYSIGAQKYQQKDKISLKKYSLNYIYGKKHHSQLQMNLPTRKTFQCITAQKQSKQRSYIDYIRDRSKRLVNLKDREEHSLSTQIKSFYMQNEKNLKKNKGVMNELINLIHLNHPFFHKINPILIKSLIKLGFITCYKEQEKIYSAQSKIKNIGFILWGHSYIKKYKSKQKYICSSGQTLGEEILFENVNYKLNSNKLILKGEFFTTESCRAITDCGILFIGQQELDIIIEELISNAFKADAERFKNILQRNYLKKKQFRRK